MYKDQLIQHFQNGLTFERLSDYLRNEYNITVTARTIKRRFKEWDVRRYIITETSDELKERIKDLFFRMCLNDNEILDVLTREGHQIGPTALVRIRLDLNLRRRVNFEEINEVDFNEHVRELISNELKKGEIEGYGYRFLYTYMRQRRQMIGRDRLYKVYKELNPIAVDRRKRDLQRHRGQYVVPGPNFIWSIDGYDKLKPYGIEIYACIDAYSRCIIWLYIGVSNATQHSILLQYLQTIELLELQPRFVRSDRGRETVQLADTHFELQKDSQPDLEFKDCYMYGTSTANQRIESWWLQMSKQLLWRYRV